MWVRAWLWAERLSESLFVARLSGMERDVVVVGAGISGLSVASALLEHGLSVIVLEARSEVGGRLRTANSALGSFDLGASWFWPGEDRVAALVARLGVPVHPHAMSGDAMYDGPLGEPPVGNQDASATRLDGNPIDSVSFRFSDGARSLSEGLADHLPDGVVLLDAPVAAVQTSTDGSNTRRHTVRTRDGSAFVTDHVVLALPPALAISSFAFKPPLPEPMSQLAAATPVWMGGMQKVVAVYPAPFWRNLGLAGSAMSHIGPLREIHDMSGPDGAPAALFGFAPSQPVGVGELTNEAIVDQLVRLFGPEAGRPTEIHIADWLAEHYTSPPGAERLNNYRTYGHVGFSHTADLGLHWSSTETSSENPGHIEGALAAAERVVSEILAARRPATTQEQMS